MPILRPPKRTICLDFTTFAPSLKNQSRLNEWSKRRNPITQHMKKKFYSIFSMMLLSAGALFAQTSTFNFTGQPQSFTVPCGVDTLFVQTWGAQGGSGAAGGGGSTGGSGGLGGYSEGWLLVTPGEVLNIMVGDDNFIFFLIH